MIATTIDEVIATLDEIVALCEREESCLGYFPALYRNVTIGVRDGIASGRFEDGERMERLDVVFANRYLEAFFQHRAGKRPTRAWEYAFKLAEAPHVLIIQHLLLGMNAHINLDLGIAAAQVVSNGELAPLKRDFDEINIVLAEKVDAVQEQLSHCSPLMRLLDGSSRWADEVLAIASLRTGRRLAWRRASALAPLTGVAFERKVRRFDRRVYLYARAICPAYLVNPLYETIRAAELPDVRQIIHHLR